MTQLNPLQIVMLGPGLKVKGGISRNEQLFLDHAPDSVQITHISSKEDGSNLLKVQVFIEALLKLFWMLSTTNIDSVHIQGCHRGSAFRQAMMTLLVLVFRKPIVLQTHASEFHIFYANLNPIWRKFISWSFCQCDRFVVLSEGWKEFHTTNLGLKPEQVTVMYNPVRVPPEVPLRINPVPDEPIKLIFSGYIGKRKGAFDLINPFAQLTEPEKSNSILIMAGDGEVEAAKNLVQSLNLQDNIIFPGWINTEQRDRLLTQADIFVLPSYNEGLPLSMLEAMAWELPVIVTPVGGIAEIVTDGDNGLLIEPGNVEQLSAAMQTLITNQDLRLSLRTKARKSIMPQDINNYWLSFLKIYDSAIESKANHK